MEYQQFLKSLENDEPPKVSSLLQAMWFDAKDDWDQAHRIVQDMDDAAASWIHAYLHRKEGDLGNAGYWYHRAGRNKSEDDLSTEWEEIVKELL